MTSWSLTNSDFPTNQIFHQFHDLHTELALHRLWVVSMEHLQRVWHASRERLPFWTPGCLCSNCWDKIPRTCHVFTRLFTSNTPWYLLDFASALTVKHGTHTSYDKRITAIDLQSQRSRSHGRNKSHSYQLIDKVRGQSNALHVVVKPCNKQTEPFQLGPFSFVHILLMTKRQHVLLFKVMCRMSRSHAQHCCLTL